MLSFQFQAPVSVQRLDLPGFGRSSETAGSGVPCYENRQASFGLVFHFFDFFEAHHRGYGNELRRARRFLLAGVEGGELPRGPRSRTSGLGCWANVFPATCKRGVRRLLAQPAIRVRAHWSQPIMTFPYRQAGKRARPIYRTDNSPCGKPPKGGYGSRAVFQNCFHPSKKFRCLSRLEFFFWFKSVLVLLTHLPA